MSAAAGDERSRLLRALALSRRFHLLLAYVESPRAADQLVRALAEELPRLRKAPVELTRLDPYEDRETAAPLEDSELADRVLIPLLSPTEERRAHGVVHVVDASRATPADTEAWGRLFALWNEKRNALQQLGGEVLVVLPEPLQRLFATAAPDVWSIRSGEYVVGEEAAKFESAATPGAVPAESRVALDWYCALPPLALFGGDLLVRPWLKDIAGGADVEDLVAEPAFRDGLATERALDQRALRRAEHALGQGRFAEAEDILSSLSKHPSKNARERANTVRRVALAAQDRAPEAMPLRRSGRASAYVHWCAGHLVSAASDVARPRKNEEIQSWALRLLERGEIASANRWPPELSYDAAPFHGEDNQLIRADCYFLTGSLRRAATILGAPLSRSTDLGWTDDELAAAVRFETLAALVELARGHRPRAVFLLSHRRCGIKHTKRPEMAARVAAFHAFASGLLQVDGQNPTGAVVWFARARAHVATWSLTGFDRRSLHRASLAIDLAHATIDPTPTNPVGVARHLVERAIALLGDTSEDFIARVLAVETRRELARRLADIGDDDATAEAHRALDLARPLAGRGVPAWDAILAATERAALTQSMR